MERDPFASSHRPEAARQRSHSDDGQADRIVVRSNLLLFWFRTKASLFSDRLEIVVPNSFLLIPAGSRRVVQPLDRITHVSVSTRYHAFRMAIGVALLVGAAHYFEEGADGGPSLLIAAGFFFAYSVTVSLKVTDASGSTQHIPVSSVDRRKVESFAELVKQAVVDPPGARNPVTPTVTAQSDRLAQLAELHRLLEAGALSRAEYEREKRRLLD